MKEYKLNGKYTLEVIVKKEVARWVLFLKSNYEYNWAKVPLAQRALHMLTLGLLGMSYKKVWASTGDVDVWPFLKTTHFNKAKEKHGYLGK